MISENTGNMDDDAGGAERLSQPVTAAGIRRILIVDDDETLARSVQFWLERAPYFKASIATSALQALECLAEERYDLLMTDYRMPGLNGITLATRVRGLYPRMVMVILTAYNSEELRKQAAQLGIHRVLAKPVTLADLRVTVLQALLTSQDTTVPKGPLSFFEQGTYDEPG